MAVYKVSPGIVKRKKLRLIVSQVLSAALISAVFVYTWYNMENREAFWSTFSDTILMIAVLFPVYSVYLVYRGFKRLDTYQVTVTDSTLTLHMYNRPACTLYLSDITAITRYPNGTYRLQCKDTRNNMILSGSLDDPQAFEAELNITASVAESTFSRGKWISVAFYIAIALALYGQFFHNVYAQYVFVIFMACFGLWYAAQLLRSRHTTTGRKVLICAIILFLLLSFVTTFFVIGK